MNKNKNKVAAEPAAVAEPIPADADLTPTMAPDAFIPVDEESIPEETPLAESFEHTLTEQDIKNNPELMTEYGMGPGDVVTVPSDADLAAKPSELTVAVNNLRATKKEHNFLLLEGDFSEVFAIHKSVPETVYEDTGILTRLRDQGPSATIGLHSYISGTREEVLAELDLLRDAVL